MRLCHIVPSLAERHGGPSKSVRALANALAGTGHAVDLLATVGTGEETPAAAGDAARLQLFPRTAPEWMCRAPALAAHLGAHPCDCVHHHSLWLRTLHYAARAARRQRVPLVISPRGMMSGWAYRHRRWRKQLAQWFIHPGAFAAAAGWHATSRDEADAIRALGYRQPICVAPNGVELPESAALAAARTTWSALAPTAAGRRVALFYSRLHRKKRVRELIELWLSVPRGDWLLLVAGSAEEYSAAELRAEIAARGGAGGIAVVDSAGQPPPYALASLFLLPSHSENFGLVIAEALAAGVPAVVTDTTPWRDLASHDAGACVAWENYPAALEAALAETPEALAARGRHGREWMARDFSWPGAARTLDAFYRQLTHG